MKRLRVDNVGSLLRPAALREAFASLSGDELARAQDDAIRAVLACQVALGMPVVTDGEFRRTGYLASFRDVEGAEGWLAEAGCRYVHIDEPGFTAYADEASLRVLRERGEDPAEVMRRSVEANNALIDGFPGVTFGVHLCRGNRESQWHREGTYDAIAEAVLGGLRYDRLLLEYDTERAGGFEPLRFVRDDAVVVLGLLRTKTGALEDADAVKRRIEEASAFVPVERLALSTQCGFASGIRGNLITDDEQWRKLEFVLRVAQDVWDD